MPIYEYRCRRCGAEFERLLPMERAAEGGPCPQCGSEEIERCLSLFASFSREGGESRALGGSSGCASCTASSCATCGQR
ncbi:MAG: FmdB family zinc ribbon protein [Chloroflexia bacterium]